MLTSVPGESFPLSSLLTLALFGTGTASVMLLSEKRRKIPPNGLRPTAFDGRVRLKKRENELRAARSEGRAAFRLNTSRFCMSRSQTGPLALRAKKSEGLQLQRALQAKESEGL